MLQSYFKKGMQALLCAAMMSSAILLVGCGDDGSRGATGTQGPQGPEGPPGTGTAIVETCSICHDQGRIADIAVAHPDDPAFTGDEVIISAITLTNNAGSGLNDGQAMVSFHLATTDGTPVTDLVTDTGIRSIDVDDFLFIMADLVPAGTPTLRGWGTWDTPYWERWVYERTPDSTGYPQGTLNNLGGGDYTYTFATEFGSAEALADAPDYDVTHVQRLLIRFDGRDDINITQRTSGFLDFNIPAADGSTAVALDPQRQFVTAEACEQCHSPNWERAAHASGYRDIRGCVLCHSPLGYDSLESDPVKANRGQFMQDNDTYASVFFHKIHGAIDIDPQWSNRIGGRGYGAVTFPQVDANGELRDCIICHVDLNGNLGTQAFQIDNWKTHPTAEICVSCHTDVDPIAGTNHGGGAQTNSTCTVCHQDTGPSTTVTYPIPVAHDITPRIAGTNGTRDDGYLPQNIPEFDVTLSLTTPANGTYYAAGEVIDVLVTLTDHATGTAVAPAIYTTPQDVAGASGGGLRIARLYVYGPRAKPVPVLATDTITDPIFDSSTGAPDQFHDLFVGGTDPQVTTSSSGFSYKLLPIPDDMEPGTYMVRVRFGDYSRIDNDNYVIESTAFTTVQIGTDVEEDKVAGDACTNCHGTGTAPFHDALHSVVFDTDECLSCHDQSGNHAVPIANRVHAVHSSNPGGDIAVFSEGDDPSERDWSDVTFPREIHNCNTCHNSGYDPVSNTFEGTYKTLPYMMPCSGCHIGESNDFQGDLPFVPEVIYHMRRNGGPW